MKKLLFRQYLFLFFSASILGYLWEVVLLLLQEDQFYNRGFLYGPWLPVYGFGAVVLYFSLHWLSAHPFYIFSLSVLLGTCVELIAGLLLDLIWHKRYWDYTGELLNYRGYICLSSSLAFGIAGVFWICFCSRHLLNLWNGMPGSHQSLLLSILLFILILDIAAALVFPNSGRGITFVHTALSPDTYALAAGYSLHSRR